jgi:hypothetical protein
MNFAFIKTDFRPETGRIFSRKPIPILPEAHASRQPLVRYPAVVAGRWKKRLSPLHSVAVLGSRTFSAAAARRAPDVVCFGSSCGGNLSSWAWASILMYRVYTSVPTQRPRPVPNPSSLMGDDRSALASKALMPACRRSPGTTVLGCRLRAYGKSPVWGRGSRWPGSSISVVQTLRPF